MMENEDEKMRRLRMMIDEKDDVIDGDGNGKEIWDLGLCCGAGQCSGRFRLKKQIMLSLFKFFLVFFFFFFF